MLRKPAVKTVIHLFDYLPDYRIRQELNQDGSHTYYPEQYRWPTLLEEDWRGLLLWRKCWLPAGYSYAWGDKDAMQFNSFEEARGWIHLHANWKTVCVTNSSYTVVHHEDEPRRPLGS